MWLEIPRRNARYMYSGMRKDRIRSRFLIRMSATGQDQQDRQTCKCNKIRIHTTKDFDYSKIKVQTAAYSPFYKMIQSYNKKPYANPIPQRSGPSGQDGQYDGYSIQQSIPRHIIVPDFSPNS